LIGFADLLAIPLLTGIVAVIVRLVADQLVNAAQEAGQAAQRYAALAEAAQRRAGHVDVLIRVGGAIASGISLADVLEILYRRIRELVRADAFYVALYDEPSGMLTFPLFYDGDQPLYMDPNDVRERPGMAGEVIRRKATLYLPNIYVPEIASQYQIVQIGGEDSHTYLGVPMFIEDRLIGIMSVQSSQVDAFAEDQIALFEALATQAAIAIQNARLYDQTVEALEREQRLNYLQRTISQTLDLSQVLEQLARLSARYLQADMATLALVSPDEQVMTDVYDYNLPEALDGVKLPRGAGLAWQIILSRRTLRLDDYAEFSDPLPEMLSVGGRACLGVPLISAQQNVLGSLTVISSSPKRRFSERDQALLESIAMHASAAIQNARLYAALRQREAISEAAAYAAGAFLSLPDWRMGIQSTLVRLGGVTGASHVALCENLVQGGQEVCVVRYRWSASEPDTVYSAPVEDEDAALPQAAARGPGDLPGIALDSPGWQRWRRSLACNEPFSGSLGTLLPEEAEQLRRLGLRSLLSVPVFLDGHWWGDIRLDDAACEREWSPAEVDGLKIVAGVLGAAIQRQQFDQALKEREALYRRTISAGGAVPYVEDYLQNRYLFFGEGIDELTGYSAFEMTPMLWRSLVRETNLLGESAELDYDQAVLQARLGKLETWRCDYLIRTRSGEQRWISDTAVEILGPDGRATGSMGMLVDITARREVEEAVRRLNSDLEARVRERTAELEAANRELEAFAYSVAHDLRAPLRSIDGYSKLLGEDYRQALDGEARVYLENVRLAAQRMGQLIDDLLLLSRVTRVEMHRTQVNLSQLAADVVEWLRRQNPERKVEVAIQPELWVQGDASLLRLALENLVGNAWKFTGKTDFPMIEIGVTRRGNGQVYYVRDNGAGFDMKYAGQLFKAFHRLHASQDYEGTGVGLATVYRVIQRHGGAIWARAATNLGATFYFTLES
ncbi:MAG: GAF domain-containing protein, partial [Chloroflexota bacterium]